MMKPQTNFKQKLSSRKLFDEIRKCSSITYQALKKRFEMSFRIQKKFVNKAYFARSVHFFLRQNHYSERIIILQIDGVKNQISLSRTSQPLKIAKKRAIVCKNIPINKAYFARKPTIFYVKRYVVAKVFLNLYIWYIIM